MDTKDTNENTYGPTIVSFVSFVVISRGNT